MGTSVEETIKEIQGRENIFVAYSQTTKLPYVTCGEESFNDQAWFFTEEEAIKEFGKKKIEEKVLLMGMRYEKKDFPKMYGLLFSIGVNTIMWNDGGEQMEIDLERIVRKPDLSKVEPQKRPLINPTLQLFRNLLHAGTSPSGTSGRAQELKSTGRRSDRKLKKIRFSCCNAAQGR